MVEAGVDHLLFCGANRLGAVVQWLTQRSVTSEAIGVLTPGLPDALFEEPFRAGQTAVMQAQRRDAGRACRVQTGEWC